MKIAPFMTLPYALERDPPPFEANAVKYPESLVRHFLKNFTKRGDKVFDPFAGLGTTLFVAEDMGRIPFGIEADEKRHGWSAGQLKNWQHLVHGDTLKLSRHGFPKMDFCIASPPYMPSGDQWNPLSGGNPAKAGYANYLKQLRAAYGQISTVMKRNAPIVVVVDNVQKKNFTPLVRDMSVAISGVFTPIGETIIAWDNGPAHYKHTHCLIFKNA